MKTLYLAGPINGRTDGEAKGWRESVKVALGDRYAFLDPMVRDYRGKESENVAAIIEGDKADIRAADAVLVFALRPSWGTAMEVFYAAELGKRVVAVCQPPVSPWLQYHAHVVPILGDAVVLLAGAA